MDVNRRRLVKGLAAAGATTLTPDLLVGQGSPAPDTDVPRRPMGKTGLHVSVIGLGGFHLGSAKDQGTANDIVAHAIDAGVNFFDNAWDYHDGLSETRLGEALQGKRDKVILMTKVCTHGRDARVAMQMLEESLRRLRTDHLDVWQIHEVIYDNDPDLIFAPGRAAEALLQAKQQGKVRFVGFSGHKDPAIHLRMLAHDFPFDTIQMPLNCLDATFRSFEQRVLPEANRRGLAVFGMKSFGGGGEIVKYGAATPDEALRYAMSLPVSTTISGIESPDVLTQNLSIATKFSPMTADEMRVLRERCRPLAADGRFELFKTTKMYDGAVGRAQHHFPTTEKLPA
jgi:aryl-alcohol dehydrogenase-like predicted oxidoreductase